MTRPVIAAVGRLAAAATLIGLLSGCAPGHPEFWDTMPWDALLAPPAADPPWLETFRARSDARARVGTGSKAGADADADHDRPLSPNRPPVPDWPPAPKPPR